MTKIKIPKLIHYCWFGRNEKPDDVKQCMQTWKILLPDYQIIEWNEDNFDVNKIDYTKEAHESKKYAFVSDVSRLYALYHYGGIYLDTDVEVLKSFNDLLHQDFFIGMEGENYIGTGIIGSKPKHPLLRELLIDYSKETFFNSKGEPIYYPHPKRITEKLIMKYNFVPSNSIVKLEQISIFPQEYFSPELLRKNKYNLSENTYTIHYYLGSWVPFTRKIKIFLFPKLKKILIRMFGEKQFDKINKVRKK